MPNHFNPVKACLLGAEFTTRPQPKGTNRVHSLDQGPDKLPLIFGGPIPSTKQESIFDFGLFAKIEIPFISVNIEGEVKSSA